MNVFPLDLVVCVPAKMWQGWVAEGDSPSTAWSGYESFFLIGKRKPQVPSMSIERVYIVAHGKLRGYAPLTRIAYLPREDPAFDYGDHLYALVRRGGAIAVTIRDPIVGFRGFRYRWWDRAIETPFPEWREP